MPYPGSFLRVVLIGSLYADQFNTSFSLIPLQGSGTLGVPPADAGFAEDVADVVAAWWVLTTAAGGLGISVHAQLTSIKVNRIGSDGKYVDSEAIEHIYSSPVQGPVNTAWAPQLAQVATLATAIPRGRGSKGRMYFPPNNWMGQIASDGRITAANALNAATAVAGLLDDINIAADAWATGDSNTPVVGVASNVGAGAFTPVTHVRVGRVFDTIRSRRNAMVEDYQDAALT